MAQIATAHHAAIQETAKVVVQPIASVAERELFNSSNHCEYRPFVLRSDDDGDECRVVCIEARWWASLAAMTQHDIELRLALRGYVKELVDSIAVPHAQPHDAARREVLNSIYFAFCRQYDYHRWCTSLGPTWPARLMTLERSELVVLRQLAAVRAITNRPLKAHDVADLSARFMQQVQSMLDDVLRHCELGAFVKLSSTSGKNDRPLRPLRTAEEVVDFLTSSKTIAAEFGWYLDAIAVRRSPAALVTEPPQSRPQREPDVESEVIGDLFDGELDEICTRPEQAEADNERERMHSGVAAPSATATLVFVPWKAEIAIDNEYRVFMLEGRPVAISQQAWYVYLGAHSDAKCVAITRAAQRLCHELVVARSIPFTSAVLDVWIEWHDGGGGGGGGDQREADCTAHLIEFNPWGVWASSGAALFHWVRDMDILVGRHEREVFFRYLQEQPPPHE